MGNEADRMWRQLQQTVEWAVRRIVQLKLAEIAMRPDSRPTVYRMTLVERGRRA